MTLEHQRSTQVMGIVNVTPDSFSDGGHYFEPKSAIEHAYDLVRQGAQILDIGAESTRPGHIAVEAEEEWRRLYPVLKELCVNTNVPISVDTYKGYIAQMALEMGVSIINDVWGGKADRDMLRIVAQANCTYIWMHNRETTVEEDTLATVIRETRKGIDSCLEAGISRDKLWIDPGIGFAKTYQGNLVLLQGLKEYCGLGYPVLLGTSRKRVIGRSVGDPAPEDRLAGSLATVALGVDAGVSAVRVHDVRESVEVCRMVEAIVNATE